MTRVEHGLTGHVEMDRAALVTVVGEIDLATQPILTALLDEAVAVGGRRVIVDLAGVAFMDARGLNALVAAANTLRRDGGGLAVRGAPERIFRLFEITGLTQALGVERPSAEPSLVVALTRGVGVPLARDVLDAALRLVVTMAQAVVGGADGVSITLPRHGRLGTVAASNDVVLEMDHDQYDTGQGPCLDAATQGERFHIDSLDAEVRWPEFVPRARARGIESILSTPLLTDDRPVGALNIYSRTVGAFAIHETRWADQFAAEAAAVVTSAEVVSSQVLNRQVHDALRSREVIAWAQGFIMQRDGGSPAAAYAVLRDASRRTGTPLRDLADQLVRSRDGLHTEGQGR